MEECKVECCQNCDYSKGSIGLTKQGMTSYLECLRYPPVYQNNEYVKINVKKHHWCGEWKPKRSHNIVKTGNK